MRAQPRTSAVASVAALFLVAVGCSEEDSITELNPAGPPAVAQLFMIAPGSSDFQLAFGEHPDLPDDDGVIDNAEPSKDLQRLRIVVDELLVGNTLEQIQCNNEQFVDVPDGITPDDVDDCSGSLPEDLADCTSLCVFDGEPNGLRLIEDSFGVPRLNFRIRHNADDEPVVRVRCDGQLMPFDTDASFWNPSGNQQVPASDAGIGGLGPAIVIDRLSLRVSSECGLEFDPTIVDKDGNQVCAPDGGDFLDGECSPGDVSRIAFGVDDLVPSTSPANGATAARIRPGNEEIILQFNADLDRETVVPENFVLSPPIDFELEVLSDSDVTLSLPDSRTGLGYATSTEYTLTIDDAVTDIFGSPLLEPFVLTYTTEPLRFTSSADGETAFEPPGSIVLEFNVLLDAVSVTAEDFEVFVVTLVENDDGEAEEVLVESGVDLRPEVDANTITLFPEVGDLPATFGPGTSYLVRVATGPTGVLDFAGNPLVDQDDEREVRFTTATFGVELASTAVTPAETVVLQFNATVRADTVAGNIAVTGELPNDGGEAPPVDFVPVAVGTTVELRLTGTYVENATYTVAVTAGENGVRAVVDPGAPADISLPAAELPGEVVELTFEVLENPPFSVELDGDTPSPVPVDATVELQFNAPVDAATVVGNVAVVGAGGAPVVDFTPVVNGSVIELTLNANYEPETEYTVTVTGGADGVKATDGRELAANAELTFTTAPAQ